MVQIPAGLGAVMRGKQADMVGCDNLPKPVITRPNTVTVDRGRTGKIMNQRTKPQRVKQANGPASALAPANVPPAPASALAPANAKPPAPVMPHSRPQPAMAPPPASVAGAPAGMPELPPAPSPLPGAPPPAPEGGGMLQSLIDGYGKLPQAAQYGIPAAGLGALLYGMSQRNRAPEEEEAPLA